MRCATDEMDGPTRAAPQHTEPGEGALFGRPPRRWAGALLAPCTGGWWWGPPPGSAYHGSARVGSSISEAVHSGSSHLPAASCRSGHATSRACAPRSRLCAWFEAHPASAATPLEFARRAPLSRAYAVFAAARPPPPSRRPAARRRPFLPPRQCSRPGGRCAPAREGASPRHRAPTGSTCASVPPLRRPLL